MKRNLVPLNERAGRSIRSARSRWLAGCLAAGLSLAFLPASAPAQRKGASAQAEIAAFHRAAPRPLWLRGSGEEAEILIHLLRSAELDGLDPDDYRPRALASAVRKARRGSPEAARNAELLLSRAFVRYVQDMRRPRDIGMIYNDPEVTPKVPGAREILAAAAAAPSLRDHVADLGWMHPVYGQLRRGLARIQENRGSRQAERLVRLNLERARVLPAATSERHILVDAAGARLYLYEGGRPVDTMRVVVGKADAPTPMMAALVRHTIVNPYWYVPPDLVRDRIAPAVLKQGTSYLREKGYEVVSDWSEKPRLVSAAKVDWKAVAAGKKDLPVRQRPGTGNAMGKMKFMFPNHLGIYLHDTPNKELLLEADRRFSAGCVRLEDAPRVARWMYGRALSLATKVTEKKVDLPEPIPVYITYLTAAPEGEQIVFRQDVYGRDAVRLAQGAGVRAR